MLRALCLRGKLDGVLEDTFWVLFLGITVGAAKDVVGTGAAGAGMGAEDAIFLNFLWVYIPADSSHLCSTGSTGVALTGTLSPWGI